MFDFDDLRMAIDDAKANRKKICIFFNDPQNASSVIWEEKPGYPDFDIDFHCDNYVNASEKNDVFELANTFFNLCAVNFPFALVLDFREAFSVSLGVVTPENQEIIKYIENLDGPLKEFVTLAKCLIYAYAKDIKYLRGY